MSRKKRQPRKPRLFTPMQRRGDRFARKLKRRSTPYERRFGLKLGFFRFKVEPQFPFTDNKDHLYIADFYIPRYALIIELDGEYHNKPNQQLYDTERDVWFINNGFHVWRITNKEADSLTTEDISLHFKNYEVVDDTDKVKTAMRNKVMGWQKKDNTKQIKMSKATKDLTRNTRMTDILSGDWKSLRIELFQISPYQIRFIKGEVKVDYYPTSGKYHDIISDTWGTCMVSEIVNFFN